MNVSKINCNNNVQNFKGLNGAKILEQASNITSWQQRLALGVTAMAIQPSIDLNNKAVEPEVRKLSAKRSFSKALVGMTTGIIVRGGCMKLVEEGLKKDSFANTLAKMTASENTKEAIDKSKDFIKNQGGAKKYASIIGTVVALGVMLFTNFLVDAPVTNWLTNKLNKNGNKNSEIKSNNETKNNVKSDEKLPFKAQSAPINWVSSLKNKGEQE